MENVFKLNTNYPDLYVCSHEKAFIPKEEIEPHSTITPESSDNVKEDFSPMNTRSPGIDLYKRGSPSSECILVDDFQELFRGILLIHNIKMNHSSSSRPSILKLVELALEMVGVYHRSLNSSINRSRRTNIHHSEVKIYLNNQEEVTTSGNLSDDDDEFSSLNGECESDELKKARADLRELRELQRELRKQGNTINFRSREKKEKQLKNNRELKIQILEQKEKIKRLETSKRTENCIQEDRVLRLVIGTLGLAVIPMLGYISGSEIAIVFHLINMKVLEDRCSRLLKKVKVTQDGEHNPHWKVIKSTILHWRKGSRKLITHSIISLTSKFGLAVGAFLGFFGAWRKKDTILSIGMALTSVAFSLWLLEKMRYSFIDSVESRKYIERASNEAESLLLIKEPYVHVGCPYNPEILK